MFGFRSINRRCKVIAVVAVSLAVSMSYARADIASPEDETFFEFTLVTHLKQFHTRFGRYPQNWIEFGKPLYCWGDTSQVKRYLPKAAEATAWKPHGCALSYKIVYGTKRGFKIVALLGNDVVSVYQNYRATYFNTEKFDHRPPTAPPGVVF